jgi:hypothetical protein
MTSMRHVRLLLVAWLGCLPMSGIAYGVDVHFHLTYALCRLAGMSAENSLWIASADQSMDDNENTTAFKDVLSWATNNRKFRHNGQLYHCLIDDGTTEETAEAFVPTTVKFESPKALGQALIHIETELGALRNAANPDASEPDLETRRIMSLIAFGQYLHARQDYYSHRQPTGNLSETYFLPYGTKWGHAAVGDGLTADYVADRPVMGYAMVDRSFADILAYARQIDPKGYHGPGYGKPVLQRLINALVPLYWRTVRGVTAIRAPNPESIPGALKAEIKKSMNRDIPIPEYVDDLKNSKCTVLPYDHPETPLSQVVDRIKAIARGL